MTAIHLQCRLRRFLPGKPDADTAFWLTVCGTAYAFSIAVTVLVVGAVKF